MVITRRVQHGPRSGMGYQPPRNLSVPWGMGEVEDTRTQEEIDANVARIIAEKQAAYTSGMAANLAYQNSQFDKGKALADQANSVIKRNLQQPGIGTNPCSASTQGAGWDNMGVSCDGRWYPLGTSPDVIAKPYGMRDILGEVITGQLGLYGPVVAAVMRNSGLTDQDQMLALAEYLKANALQVTAAGGLPPGVTLASAIQQGYVPLNKARQITIDLWGSPEQQAINHAQEEAQRQLQYQALGSPSVYAPPGQETTTGYYAQGQGTGTGTGTVQQQQQVQQQVQQQTLGTPTGAGAGTGTTINLDVDGLLDKLTTPTVNVAGMSLSPLLLAGAAFAAYMVMKK